eukprot:9338987-Pyramimonas_sp.AAC.1
MGATPRQPGSLDRKAWSHLGHYLDVELGIGASNLVYNLTGHTLARGTAECPAHLTSPAAPR